MKVTHKNALNKKNTKSGLLEQHSATASNSNSNSISNKQKRKQQTKVTEPFNLYKSWRTWIISFLARWTRYIKMVLFRTWRYIFFIYVVYMFFSSSRCCFVRMCAQFKPGIFQIHWIRIVLKKCLYPNAVIQIILLLLKWRISWLRILLYKSFHHHDPGVFISRSFVCLMGFFHLLLLCVCLLVRFYSFVHRRDIYVARLVYEYE